MHHSALLLAVYTHLNVQHEQITAGLTIRKADSVIILAKGRCLVHNACAAGGCHIRVSTDPEGAFGLAVLKEWEQWLVGAASQVLALHLLQHLIGGHPVSTAGAA